jgi:hypothetical protein
MDDLTSPEEIALYAYGGILPNRQRTQVIDQFGVKRCSACRSWLMVDMFAVAAAGTGGCDNRCRPCRSEYLKDRDTRLRANPADVPAGRVCSLDGEWKLAESFQVLPGGKLSSRCRDCLNAAGRAKEHAGGANPRPPAIVDGRKRCTSCRDWKPIADFDKGKREIRAVCRECRRPMSREYHRSDAARDRYYRRAYGITLEWYHEKLAEQSGRCAICRNPPDPNYRPHPRLVVDHRHDGAGRPRGLLCHLCNTGIGLANDDPTRLRALILYLSAHAREAIA